MQQLNYMDDKQRLKYIDQFDICRICDNEPLRAVYIMTLIAEKLGSITISEFSTVLGMNKRTVERHCKSGKIPTDNYFNRPLINIWLKNNR